MDVEEISARIDVRRERDEDGPHWTIEAQGSLTDEEAKGLTFMATPDAVVMGEYVEVVDAGGRRIGHLASATYYERPFGPAFVICGIVLR